MYFSYDADSKTVSLLMKEPIFYWKSMPIWQASVKNFRFP